MGKNTKVEQLIIPVYINEKIVLDMLAIIEDGFSTVSQVSYNEHTEKSASQGLNGEASTSVSVPLLSKLLKIDLHGEGELSHDTSRNSETNATLEKVHTNVSLLSKFRTFLMEQGGCFRTQSSIVHMNVGDFVEVEGELQKNPLIACLDSFMDFYRMQAIFSNEPELGQKQGSKQTKTKQAKTKDQQLAEQIEAFRSELVQSGTIDFILKANQGTLVLSVQNQYLTNDNISEILGGRFKVLGKIIAVHKGQNDSINLLRKTPLSFFPESNWKQSMQDVAKSLNLPALTTTIDGPAAIVIPIAIYA